MRTPGDVGLAGGWLDRDLGATVAPLRPAHRSAFQNKIVDRCERLQLQSAAIARHLERVLPAKDQAVLVSPCPCARHSVEQRWPPCKHSGVQGCPPPTPQLVQVECWGAPARFLLRLPEKHIPVIGVLVVECSHPVSPQASPFLVLIVL